MPDDMQDSKKGSTTHTDLPAECSRKSFPSFCQSCCVQIKDFSKSSHDGSTTTEASLCNDTLEASHFYPQTPPLQVLKSRLHLFREQKVSVDILYEQLPICYPVLCNSSTTTLSCLKVKLHFIITVMFTARLCCPLSGHECRISSKLVVL